MTVVVWRMHMMGLGRDVVMEGMMSRVLWLCMWGYERWIRGGRKKRVGL